VSRNPSNIPFAPSRVPFFYGWVIVAVGTLGVVMSAPGQTMGVSAFTEHLLDALGVSREQLSLAYLIGTATSGLVLTFAGKLYDRWGARVVTLLSCVGLGGMLLWCSQCDRMAAGLSGSLGGGRAAWGFVVILVGFFGIRFCGQGVLTMVSRNMVMKWFDRHRGLANGFMGVGISLGMSGAPMMFAATIDVIGWRHAWLAAAGIVAVVFGAVVLLLYRDNPEDCGLVPDGSLHDDETAVAARLAHRQFTLGEAVRTYAFWVFALALGVFGLQMTAVSFHVVSIFDSVGMSEAMALSIFMPAAVIGVVWQFAAGWISDYVPLKYLLTVMLAGLCGSMASLIDLNETTRWLLILSNALAGGSFGVLSSVTWPRYFGREHLGAISGLNMSVIVLASAIGPWLYSRAMAMTASYAPAAIGCLIFTGGLLLAGIAVRNPQTEFGSARGREGGPHKRATFRRRET
jgi:sugar phosphate permease